MDNLQSSKVEQISDSTNTSRKRAGGVGPVVKKAKFKLQEEDFFMAASSDEQSEEEDVVEESNVKVYHKKKEVSGTLH